MPKVWRETVQSATVRKTAAVDLFHHEKAHELDQNLTLGQRRRVVMAAWKNISDQERLVYQARAKAENDARVEFEAGLPGGASFADVLQGGQLTNRRNRDLGLKRAAVGRTVRQLQTNQAWRQGVLRFGTGLDPAAISQAPDTEISAKCATSFGYDPMPVQNPAGTMVPCHPCNIAHAGLCKSNEFCEASHCVSCNIYETFSQRKVDYPKLVRLKAKDQIEYRYVCKSFVLPNGNRTLIMVEVTVTQHTDRYGVVTTIFDLTERTDGMCGIATSHMVLERILALAAPLVDIVNMQVLVCTRVPEAKRYRVELEDVLFEIDLPTDERFKRKTKKAAAGDVIELPFGLTIPASEVEEGIVREVAEPVPVPDPEEGDGDDHYMRDDDILFSPASSATDGKSDDEEVAVFFYDLRAHVLNNISCICN